MVKLQMLAVTLPPEYDAGPMMVAMKRGHTEAIGLILDRSPMSKQRSTQSWRFEPSSTRRCWPLEESASPGERSFGKPARSYLAPSAKAERWFHSRASANRARQLTDRQALVASCSGRAAAVAEDSMTTLRGDESRGLGACQRRPPVAANAQVPRSRPSGGAAPAWSARGRATGAADRAGKPMAAVPWAPSSSSALEGAGSQLGGPCAAVRVERDRIVPSVTGCAERAGGRLALVVRGRPRGRPNRGLSLHLQEDDAVCGRRRAPTRVQRTEVRAVRRRGRARWTKYPRWPKCSSARVTAQRGRGARQQAIGGLRAGCRGAKRRSGVTPPRAISGSDRRHDDLAAGRKHPVS